MVKLGKRGQVTMFIIAGVIILFVAFFIGYLQNQDLRERVERGLFKGVVVPEQAKAVVTYMNDCLEEISKEGVDLAGYQGGYVKVPDVIKVNPRATLLADGINKVPYWLYGRDHESIPDFESMRSDLEDYVDERFNSLCDFEDFEDYGFSTKQIETKVEIVEGSVLVILDSEMEVNIKGSMFDLREYVGVEISSELKALYGMAIDILNRELRNAPIEFITMNLISTYASDKDIPPTAGFDYTCNPKNWILQETGEKIKDYLSDRMRYLQVEGTSNDNHGAFYRSMMLTDVFDSSQRDTEVTFNYNREWPLVLEIFPNERGVLKPNVMKFGLPLFSLFCMTFYDFRYNIQYPLMVNLEKDGYKFRFPIEVFIVNNYGGRQIDGEIENIEYGEGPISLFCNPNQRLSEPVRVVTNDLLNGEPLEGVKVNYECGVRNCLVSETEIDSGEAFIEEKFPLCYNGELRLIKEGYAEFTQDLTTVNVGSQVVLGELKPYMEKEVEIRVLEDNGFGILNERKLNENEIATVQLHLLDRNTNSIKEQIGVVFEGDIVQNINFVPEEEYNLVANLILSEKITIPGGDYEGQNLPSQEVEEAVLGGADIITYISETSLRESDKVIFFVVSKGKPTSYTEYLDSLDVTTLSDDYRDQLEWRFE